MDYGEIIKRAWRVTWRHKALWVLGIFAGVSGCRVAGAVAVAAGAAAATGAPCRVAAAAWHPASSRRSCASCRSSSRERWCSWRSGSSGRVLSIAARGGLIAGVNEVEDGRTSAARCSVERGLRPLLDARGSWAAAQPPGPCGSAPDGRVMFVPLIGALAAGREPGIEMIAPICGSLVIGIPLLLVMSFVLGIMYLVGQRYVVLGGQGAVESVGNAWRFFRARFKDTSLDVPHQRGAQHRRRHRADHPCGGHRYRGRGRQLALGALQESWPHDRCRHRPSDRGLRRPRHGVFGDLGHATPSALWTLFFRKRAPAWTSPAAALVAAPSRATQPASRSAADLPSRRWWPMPDGRLLVCATPIGNLGDVTLRVLDALRDVDASLAEDTRVTRKLFARLRHQYAARALRRGRRRQAHRRVRRPPARRRDAWRWSPTPGRPASAIRRAPGGRCARRRRRGRGAPWPLGDRRCARRQRAANTRVLLRGLPAQEGGRAAKAPRLPCPARRDPGLLRVAAAHCDLPDRTRIGLPAAARRDGARAHEAA